MGRYLGGYHFIFLLYMPQSLLKLSRYFFFFFLSLFVFLSLSLSLSLSLCIMQNDQILIISG